MCIYFFNHEPLIVCKSSEEVFFPDPLLPLPFRFPNKHPVCFPNCPASAFRVNPYRWGDALSFSPHVRLMFLLSLATFWSQSFSVQGELCYMSLTTTQSLPLLVRASLPTMSTALWSGFIARRHQSKNRFMASYNATTDWRWKKKCQQVPNSSAFQCKFWPPFCSRHNTSFCKLPSFRTFTHKNLNFVLDLNFYFLAPNKKKKV